MVIWTDDYEWLLLTMLRNCIRQQFRSIVFYRCPLTIAFFTNIQKHRSREKYAMAQQ